MREAILFDLDGTLWDATGSASALWNRILEKHAFTGFHMSHTFAAGLMGKTMDEVGAVLFPALSVEERRAITDEFGVEEVRYLAENGAVLYEGVERTITSLAEEYDLYIVSNSQDGYVPAFLQAHALQSFFRDYEMSGRTGLDKGRNICLLMERNGISRAVFAGDAASDEEAARFAGIPFIWAAYGFGTAAAPDASIQTICDLPACVREVFRPSRKEP